MLRFPNLLVDLQLAHFLLVALVEVFVFEMLPHFSLSGLLHRNSVKVVVCFVVPASLLFQSLTLKKVAARFFCSLRHVSQSCPIFEHLMFLHFGGCCLF